MLTNSYTPTNLCATVFADTITAIGQASCGSVSSTCTADCPACPITNRFTIIKGCASPVGTNVGTSLIVTGQVCNLGNIDLTNVVVIDSNNGGIPTTFTNIIPLLPAGSCMTFSFTYTATTCSNLTDIVTASGRNLCGAFVGPVSAGAQCFLCCPAISIQKLVACLRPSGQFPIPTCPPALSDYSTSATGVLGNTGDPLQDNPAFCYVII